MLLTPEGVTRIDEVEHRIVFDHTVHNLTVAGLHTYHVAIGDHDVLTHNTNDKCGEGGPRLSDENPVPRDVREQYEEIQLGNGTPRVDPATGAQTVHRGNERTARLWRGALEWDVPGTRHRILEQRFVGQRSRFGYVLNHDYNRPRVFPAPWYPDGGRS